MSSLNASEFDLTPARRDWWRPPVVTAVVQPEDTDTSQLVPTTKGYVESQYPIVAAVCVELRKGITTQTVARLLGIDNKRASTYLSRLQQRGVLEFDPSRIRTNGRPAKVYRVRETA